jgi:hypothetical protein
MFRIPEIGLEVHKVMNGENSYIEDLIQLYLELFPRYGRYVQVMRRRAANPADALPPFIEHQWLALMHGEPAALMVFKYNKLRNCGIGLDLGVHPRFKSIKHGEYDRLAKLLIDLRRNQIVKDAAFSGNPLPLGVIVEVESPKVVRQFSKYGMIQLPIKYFEPPAPESVSGLMEPQMLEVAGYKPMKLGIYPLSDEGINYFDEQNLVNFVKAILVDHYGLLEDHWVVRESLESILNKENLK